MPSRWYWDVPAGGIGVGCAEIETAVQALASGGCRENAEDVDSNPQGSWFCLENVDGGWEQWTRSWERRIEARPYSPTVRA